MQKRVFGLEAPPDAVQSFEGAVAGTTDFANNELTHILCSRDDGSYGGTNHGWPCFANSRIHAFFETLK